MPRRTPDLRAYALAVVAMTLGAGPAAVAGCSAQPAKNPSYLLVTLDVPASLPIPPHAARVEVSSAAIPGMPQSLCVQLMAPGAAVPASFVLQRAYGQDPKPLVTLQVTAFDTLEGGSDGIAGKDFPCPAVLPPPLAPPQTVTLGFCASTAEALVVHVGASCCGAVDGGAPDAGDGGTGEGGTDGGAGEGGTDDGGAGEGGTDGGMDGGMDGGTDGGGTGACCAPMEVCGAGLGTDGYACAPDACCASQVSSACALDPAQ